MMDEGFLKWTVGGVVAIFAISAPLMYVEMRDKRAREHEAHLERMEQLRALPRDGGTP